jgi:phosphatidylserine decarboxylase
MSAVTYVTARILRVLPRARIGHALGQLAERPWSPTVGRTIVRLYSRAYGVALDECADPGNWPSFDAFFTRRLRRGVRQIDATPGTVVSPADGRIESIARIDEGGTFVVKGRPYTVPELIGSESDALRFRGGTGLVVYLSPRDYHRVHAPVGGEVRRIRSMPGDYFPVNPIGARYVPNLFCRNRRVAIDVDGSDGLGRVTVVLIAAMIVGRITAIGSSDRDVPLGDHVFDPPLRVGQGDEIGVFHLGSTAVVLVERHAASRWIAQEGPIHFGQALVRVRDDASRGAALDQGGGQ